MPELSPANALLFLRDEDLRQGFDLLYFAQRDLEAAGAILLEQHGLHGGHRRAIHFLARQPEIAVTELLELLGLTKQSLGRLLNELEGQGLVRHRQGIQDRRQRLLSLTEAGRALERQLWEQQRIRIARAFRESGPQAVEGFRRVLDGLTGKTRPMAAGSGGRG
jgi:DNA-binding MarR family transcriptional regulator